DALHVLVRKGQTRIDEQPSPVCAVEGPVHADPAQAAEGHDEQLVRLRDRPPATGSYRGRDCRKRRLACCECRKCPIRGHSIGCARVEDAVEINIHLRADVAQPGIRVKRFPSLLQWCGKLWTPERRRERQRRSVASVLIWTYMSKSG